MDFLLAIIGLFVGGGGVWIFIIKSTRTKARAEAMKEVQDVYQETIIDLREDKRLLKAERDADRCRYAEIELQVNDLKVAMELLRTELEQMKLKRLTESCLDFKCKNRVIA